MSTLGCDIPQPVHWCEVIFYVCALDSNVKAVFFIRGAIVHVLLYLYIALEIQNSFEATI